MTRTTPGESACPKDKCLLSASLTSLASFRSWSLSIVSLALLCIASLSGAPQSSENPAVLAELRDAFAAAYNLDHAEALHHARRAVALDPQSSRAHRGLASILWLKMLFDRGAVSVDHYMGSISKSQANLPKPDPVTAEEFKRLVARAIDLANARLKANPRDLDAKFDAGAAYGVQASYVAAVEGSVMSAFGIARKAFDAQEEVLERNPARVGAGLIVGTYRYLVSTFNFATRIVAWMAGFAGGKERGIALLEAATKDPESRVDAQAALMLIYSREGRHREVVRITRQLSAEYPRNRLFVLEEGAASIRAGMGVEADAALTRGLAMLANDPRPRVPGEEALWLYKRGLARLNLNRPGPASDDLSRALAMNPTTWVRGRIHVEMGKLADLAGRRPDAVTAYRTAKSLCESVADAICAGEAGRLLKRPFTFSAGGPIH